ncbi:MAG: hypothetical protein GY941_22220 [Planctomycetes bacterium]|nr:hypothetical protein [Planctomycetota bacterium]
MKKLTLIVTIMLMVGCKETTGEAKEYTLKDVSYMFHPMEATYDGHTYLIMEGAQRFGITHHPDCPCGKED